MDVTERPGADVGGLHAVSDLHVGNRHNREVLKRIRPANPDDWLIAAGDVAERLAAIEWALTLLRDRFATCCGCRATMSCGRTAMTGTTCAACAVTTGSSTCAEGLEVATPEDPCPLWDGADGPVRTAPLFLLYDYTVLAPGTTTKEESLRAEHASRVVCTDEYLLHPDPYSSREAWCRARVEVTEQRLAAVTGDDPLGLVNHWPLMREPTRIMTHQHFPQWCETELTADWHTRFGASVAVYGHLHIPRRTNYDGVRFEEVSIGYPREWRHFGLRTDLARLVMAGAPG